MAYGSRKNKNHTDDINDGSEEKEETVASYIKKIRKSDHHDNVGHGLYALMCHNDTPPYSMWVATWLIKCIRECFNVSYETDILLASFALLPGYTLVNTDIEKRLEKYVEDSDYLSKYPSKSGRSIEEIMNDPNSKEEFDSIKEKIGRKERSLVNKLVEYIEDILDPKNHIEDLADYGTLERHGTKKFYKPKPQKLCFPKTEKQQSLSRDIVDMEQDTQTISSDKQTNTPDEGAAVCRRDNNNENGKPTVADSPTQGVAQLPADGSAGGDDPRPNYGEKNGSKLGNTAVEKDSKHQIQLVIVCMLAAVIIYTLARFILAVAMLIFVLKLPPNDYIPPDMPDNSNQMVNTEPIEPPPLDS